MAVNGVNNTNSSNSAAATATQQKPLDKDAFLSLLVTELQNQDPMNPMDEKDSIAQLAQFSALEQMQQVNQTQTATEALSMIGKKVDYLDKDSKTVTGTVTSLTFESGAPKLTIDGASVDVEKVTKVYPVNQSDTAAVAIAMIGKKVDYIDAKNATATGTVANVTFKDGIPSLTIGSVSVDVGKVTKVYP